jgi:hypothetical protein
VGAGSPVFEQIFHIGFEIEKALRLCGVKVLADPKSPGGLTGNLWPFGGGLEKPDPSEGRRDSIKRDFKRLLLRLGNVRDTGAALFGDAESGSYFDTACLGGFVQATVDKVGRELEEMAPALGIKIEKDHHVFLPL